MPASLKRREGFPGQRLVVLPAPILARAAALPISAWLLPTHLGRFNHAEHHHVERRHGCPEHILLACLDGAGHVKGDGIDTMIQAGDVALLPPGKRHAYGADAAAPWTIFWFHFRGAGAHAHRDALLAGGGGPVFRVREPGLLVEAFEETFRHVLGGFTDADLFALSTSFSRFLGLCRVHQQARDRRRRETEERVLRVIRHMRANLDRQIPLDELARLGGWSPTHFSTLFRRQTNAPPLAFLNRLRMQKACDLLKTSDDPVGTIAAAVGFDDAFYFSRIFHKLIGLPPTSYRSAYTITGDFRLADPAHGAKFPDAHPSAPRQSNPASRHL